MRLQTACRCKFVIKKELPADSSRIRSYVEDWRKISYRFIRNNPLVSDYAAKDYRAIKGRNYLQTRAKKSVDREAGATRNG
jgi:hypothetical protein